MDGTGASEPFHDLKPVVVHVAPVGGLEVVPGEGVRIDTVELKKRREVPGEGQLADLSDVRRLRTGSLEDRSGGPVHRIRQTGARNPVPAGFNQWTVRDLHLHVGIE